MSEQKPKMSIAPKATKKETQQISYEELSKMAGEMQMQGQKLYEENIQLRKALQEQGELARLSFLFEVLKADKHFNKDVIFLATEDIEAMLFPEEEEVTEDPQEVVEETE